MSLWPGITGASLVCLRFDDYHQSIDQETWHKTLKAFDSRNLRGVIAICPKYNGQRLSGEIVPFLRNLQDKGWELAQHGYEHENVGEGRGGLIHQDRSEFCGLPLNEQIWRVGTGLDILQEHGIEPTTFIPPWHEWDHNTVRAVDSHGFNCINEGRWLLPRTVDGIVLVPTHLPAITPNMLGVGVSTLVAHPHLDENPLKNADVVSDYEDRIRTPREVVNWWKSLSMGGSWVKNIL